jgi:hypothetical protein
MDIATKFASGQEAVEAIFRKDKQPQGRQLEDVPEASTQRGTKKKGKKKSHAKCDAADADLVAAAEYKNPRKPPEAPISSTRCSRSCAPIIRGPSSTPLRSAPCFGATFTRRGHLRRVAGTATTIRRKITRLHDLWWASGECLGSAPQARASRGLLGKGGGTSLPRLVRQAHHLRLGRPPRPRAESEEIPARCRPRHRQR